MRGRFAQPHHLALAGLLALFFVLATVYNAVSTPFEAPDEIGHFYYVIHLLQTGRLPVVPATDPPPNYEQEGIQPPLYYASAAFLARLLERPLRLDLEDADAPLDVNPHSVCARPGARYNVTYLAHDPHQERFPYMGRVRVLHAIRLWSSLLGVATVAGVFAATRLAFPDVPVAAWLAASLTAFTPEFLFTAGAVSNDNLVTALTTWGVYLALRTWRDGLRWPRTLALGLLAGLAALSKLSGALLLPLTLFVILLTAVSGCSKPSREPSSPHSPFAIRHLRFAICDLRFALVHCSLFIASLSIVSGWWFFRNWTLYGDLTGTRPMLEMLPLRHQMSVDVLIRELPGLFRSWWGALGCTAPPAGFYVFYLVFVLGGLAGLVANRRHDWQARKPAPLRRNWLQMGVLLVWLALLGVAYVYWNWVIHAPKGRLLYPAMVSVAGFLGRGWAYWAARWRGLLPILFVALVAGAAVVPFAVLAPPVAAPPILPIYQFTNLPIYQFAGRFGSEIALLGYDLDGVSFEAGEWLDLTLYWQVLARPADHYTLAIQLVSAAPGETDTLANFNTWTGGGNYPTGLWHPGDVITDRYRLQLPADVRRAQGWALQVILFDPEGGRRLPFTLDDQPASDAAILGLLRVGATDPAREAPPTTDRRASPILFEGAVALDGMQVTAEGKNLDVTLWWQSVAPLSRDAVVFVHLYDAGGQLVTTADGPPLSGGFPTSLWQPGDRVRDERAIPPPRPLYPPYSPPIGGGEGKAPFWLGVGWYDPATGARLAATTADGVRLPNDELLLPVTP